ncbi:endonuclease [Metabacillus sp. KIGAM252]|uniref:Endonuclease n=1 Tax=Metabacillus flavus TaxID=2823519 RepID=A0ABS5LJM1_9BACI|nr:endonuclease [Metabacillus flavus]MBS2970668.1 endonuclease [Metabacillus flavus]
MEQLAGITLSKKAIEIVTGKLLGDANISNQTGRKPRFRFSHCLKDRGWCQFCYDQLKNDLPLNEPVYRLVKDERIQGGYTEQYYVQSKTHPAIELLKSIWYTDGKKKLPYLFLEQHLTPLTLAVWYQDDGNLKLKELIPRKITLSTESFSLVEIEFLQSLLRQKFSLAFSIDSKKRLLLYNQPQIYYFLRLVQPYIHSSMQRKQFVPRINEIHFTKKRTTIYLPGDILLTKPTAQIQKQLENLSYIHTQISNEPMNEEFYKEYVLAPQSEARRGYQIELAPSELQELAKVQALTGLRISRIMQICFEIEKRPSK